MDLTTTGAVDWVQRMSEFTDDEDEDGFVDIRFRGPESLREELKHLAKIQAEVRRIAGKNDPDYSANRLLNFVVRRWVRGWKKRFGDVPESSEGIKKAAEQQHAYEEEQKRRK